MIAPLIGGLITGGISLLGGLFGRSDAKKQKKSEEKAIAAANQANAYNNEMARLRAVEAAKIPIITKNEPTKQVRTGGTQTTVGSVDMGAFLAAAEKGGFNPLTFLRSGALGAFGKSVTSMSPETIITSGGGSAVFNSMNMEAALAGAGNGGGGAGVMPVMSSVNVPGIGSIAANALGAGFNSYLDLDAQAKQESYQAAMLNAQMHGMQTNGSKAKQSYTPAGVYTGGMYTKQGNAALSSSQYAKGKKYSGPGDTIWIMGTPWKTNPNTSDADTFEQRGGEAAGWLGGAAALASDYYLNADPQSRALMDFVSQTPGQAGKQMIDYYNGALSRSQKRAASIPSPITIGADYIRSITASPTNPGKTWAEIGKDWGLSW